MEEQTKAEIIKVGHSLFFIDINSKAIYGPYNITEKYRLDVVDILNTDISDLNISNRLKKCFKEVFIYKVHKLVNKTRTEVREISGLGIKSFHELEKLYQELDLKFNMNTEEIFRCLEKFKRNQI